MRSFTSSSCPCSLRGGASSQSALTLSCPRSLRPSTPVQLRQQRLHVVVQAKGDDDGPKPLQMVDGAVDTVAGFVPSSVPRNVAKGGVYAVGGLLVFGLVQKVLSGVLTLALLGGLGYLYLNNQGGKDSGSKSDDDDDPSAPLSEARKIMDKYK